MCAVDDTLESILAGSDDEAEEDAVISQVLDEIGIEVSSKVCSQYSGHDNSDSGHGNTDSKHGNAVGMTAH